MKTSKGRLSWVCLSALSLASASLAASACSSKQRTFDPVGSGGCEDTSDCAGSAGQAGDGNNGGSSAAAGGTGEGGATGGSSGAAGSSGSGGKEAGEGGAAGGEPQGEAGSGGEGSDACVPAECDDPPSPECTDANTLLTYEETGDCTDNQCTYASGSSFCAAGCTVDACDGDEWIDLATTNRPGSRHSHTAVWTGTEMIVWGGSVGAPASYLNNGARFSPTRPEAEAWIPLTSSNAPTARADHTAVWTGDTMIIWGGRTTGGSVLATGNRYTAAGGWTTTTGTGAPAARSDHTAIWTGTEMIVWGGLSASATLATGARYDPVNDQWTATSGTDAPSARSSHSAVWTGTEMIIWGGNSAFSGDANPLNGGARYNPNTNTWTAVSTTNAPSARFAHSAVWTGTEMIIWGGDGSSDTTPVLLDSGARYNPVTNTWTALPSETGRRLHTAAWTGSEMIVWGGSSATGARYDLASNTWTPMSVGPTARTSHSAVWTGTELIVFGGAAGGPGTSTGGRYVR